MAHLLAGWLALVVVLATGCAAGSPRIVEVSHRQRVVNIAPADERIFARDRASHFRTEIVSLPVEEQRQEFLVRWRATGVRAVKLEYRLGGIPGVVRQQTVVVENASHADFHIQGAVTAWRASLWDESGQEIAEQKSALW
jgi:hypothetical protein